MTCRGSRFADGAKRNPDGQVFMKNRETDEWLKQNQKSTREFIRKWGHFCKHDQYLKPIIPPKYDLGFIIKNNNLDLLNGLEPWCSTVYCDEQFNIGRYADYVEMEDTSYDLYEKFKPYDNEKQNGILVEIDGNNFTQQDFQYIQQLPEILADSTFLEEDLGGQFEVGNLKLTINNLITLEKELIICENK